MQELRWTAALHRRELGHGFLLALGPGFVRRWHLSHVRGPWAVALAARSSDGHLLGFLLGTTDRRRHTDWVLAEDRMPLALRGAVGLATHPRALPRFLRGRLPRYARRLAAGRHSPQAPAGTAAAAPVGVVEAVAVDPGHRGCGAGAALVRAFEARCAAAGTSDLRLVTAEEDGAERFYLRLGWVVAARRPDADGRTVVELRKALPPALGDVPPQQRAGA